MTAPKKRGAGRGGPTPKKMHAGSGAYRLYHDSAVHCQSAELLDQGPPHDYDAERAVLACLLLAPARFADVALAIEADDFADVECRAIYAAMLRLHARQRPTGDLTLLVGEMRDAGVYDALDGPSAYTLLHLFWLHPHAVHLDHYIARLREFSRRRHAHERGIRLIQAANRGEPGPALPPAAIRRATRKAVESRSRRKEVRR
jgi:replicative DNA helicase